MGDFFPGILWFRIKLEKANESGPNEASPGGGLLKRRLGRLPRCEPWLLTRIDDGDFLR